MSAFSIWALSIVGIVMLGVLVDILMPEGETNKYIKSVFAIMTVFTIAAPIPKLLTQGFNLDEVFGVEQNYEIDGSFIEALNRQKVVALKYTAYEALTASEYSGVDFMVVHETNDNQLLITHIFVDVSKAEFKGNEIGSDGMSGITTILTKVFNIKKEAISFYG